MRIAATKASGVAAGEAAESAGSDGVELAIVELTDDYVVLDIAALEAALGVIGPSAAPAVSGLVKVGFPYSAQDYSDDDFDE